MKTYQVQVIYYLSTFVEVEAESAYEAAERAAEEHKDFRQNISMQEGYEASDEPALFLVEDDESELPEQITL